MSRKAILIEASNVQKLTDLPGARADIVNLRGFLLSDEGGAWRGDEIVTLSNPTRAQVETTIKAAKDVEYSMISFSGHGHHVKYLNREMTDVCLADGDLHVSQLNPGNDKCLQLIDACRNLTIIKEEYRSAAKSLTLYQKDVSRSWKYRDLFDTEIKKCENGAITMYSCGLNESAGETSEGGFFCGGLIISAENWSKKRRTANTVYKTPEAHSDAAAFVTMLAPQQHPQYEGGRRINHFPFAVYVP